MSDKNEVQSKGWKKIFDKYQESSLDPDPLKLDLQLFLLQGVDDDSKNCLHHACRNGDYQMVKVIVEACDKVTGLIQNRGKIQKKWCGPKNLNQSEEPFCKDILMGLMQQLDEEMRYTPFFYLCDR